MDYTALTDEELIQVRCDVAREQERRRVLATIPEQVDDLARRFLDAEGTEPGQQWREPTGAHDAYPEGWTVAHNGKTWESLTPACVWEPGVSGWREVTEGGTPAVWVAPTGAHDAYNTGDQVTYEGAVYESLIDSNTWSPTSYPAGWKTIEETP